MTSPYVLGYAPRELDRYRYMAESVRSMMPSTREAGISEIEAGEIDTLEDRLRDETVSGGGVLVGWPVVCACSRSQ